ncbi:MAG TPA: winged helix DNA-binding protein [Bacteroidales bacterium]
MGDKYKAIKQLVELWETYEEEGEQTDLLGFAEWVTYKVKQSPELNVKTYKKRAKSEQPESLLFLKSLEEQARILEYISRITRAHDLYIRKFFAELPINNRLEYFFLYTVHLKGAAKKTDLINSHLTDYTTGMDTIKRLVNNGFLLEKADETDKRARLLEITAEGLKLLELANKRITEETNMFLSCFSMNKWKKAMPVLEEINDFHTDIFINHGDKNAAELLNLMDSLKYLYK